MNRGKSLLKIPTWAIAGCVGMNEQTVRRHEREGRFDRKELGSIVRYINEIRSK